LSDRLEKIGAALTRARNQARIDTEVIEIMEVVISIITDIQAQLDQYEQGVAGVFTALDTALTDIAAKITALEQQVAAGGAPDPAEVAAIKQDIANAQAPVAAELAKVQAADPGAQTPPPPPPPAPSPTGPTQSVYTFDGDPTTVDTSQWVLTEWETTETPPRRLYLYTGDHNPGDKNGDGLGGVWHVYEGATQQVQAPAGG
jgi:hypothetical protein